MHRPILYGLEAAIDDAPFLTSKQFFERTGRNLGNLAFTFATASMLGDDVKGINWGTPVDELRGHGDLLVVSCANQLNPNLEMGKQADFVADADLPVVAIGLGAQSPTLDAAPVIPVGTLRWFDAMASRAIGDRPNIAVRGQYTLESLQRIGRGEQCVVLGCPSHLINPQIDLGRRIAARAAFPPKRVAVAAGFPWVPARQMVERMLADLATLTGGVYIVQAADQMLCLARGEFDALGRKALLRYRGFIRPQLSEAEFIAWCRHHMRAFPNVPAWLECLRTCDFAIGNRIHGVVLALQAGVPAVCITHDSRTLELCKTLCIPHMPMAQARQRGVNLYELEALFQFDPQAFDRRRRELVLGYRGFLADNEIPCSPELAACAAACDAVQQQSA